LNRAKSYGERWKDECDSSSPSRRGPTSPRSGREKQEAGGFLVGFLFGSDIGRADLDKTKTELEKKKQLLDIVPEIVNVASKT
jgi:hypothetical protein